MLLEIRNIINVILAVIIMACVMHCSLEKVFSHWHSTGEHHHHDHEGLPGDAHPAHHDTDTHDVLGCCIQMVVEFGRQLLKIVASSLFALQSLLSLFVFAVATVLISPYIILLRYRQRPEEVFSPPHLVSVSILKSAPNAPPAA